MDKQIEEMAKLLCGATNGCDDCMFNKVNCYEHKDAEELYNAGYRKQSEVAEEIFAEIDRFIHKVLNDEHYIMGDMCWDVAELKKKYTEVGK